MIIKSYEINKINFEKNNFYLFYGENEGFKNEIIQTHFESKYKKKIYRYDEKEILDNKEDFFNSVFTKSFFDNEKLIIILRASDKIKNVIEEIINRNPQDIKFVLSCGVLEKKSKLRSLFEKGKKTICTAFYADNHQTLSIITNNFFKEKKLPISQETINILVERSRGDRKNLYNELNKIQSFVINKKKIDVEEILKITNLSENYNVSELIDNCLAKNTKKTANILNQNNFSVDDGILITRTFLSKAKRILQIQTKIKENNNIDQAISNLKPPVFWKDKDIVKKQVQVWPSKEISNLIYKISETELLIKKNSINSINILSDFIISQSK